MKKNELVFNLNEIPSIGFDFKFSQKTSMEDLRPFIGELVTDKPFAIAGKILKEFELYTVSGEITFHTDQICSECGDPANYDFTFKFKEFLLPPGTEKQEHQLDAIPLESLKFNLGDYLYDLMASKTSSWPRCPYKNCDKRQEVREWLSKNHEKPSENEGHPGFQVLKKLKKN